MKTTRAADSLPNQAEEQNGGVNKKRIKLSRKLYIQDKNSSLSTVDKSTTDGCNDTSVKSDYRQQLYIASLHNLGNTCYLNAVLQALRYTPGYVDTINQLYAAIQAAIDCNWLDEDCLDREIGPLKLVRSLHELFRKMAASEERCCNGTSTFFAQRPYDLLELIGLLNVDFEGSQQHDAHELLQWMQGSLQEAWMRLRDAAHRHAPHLRSAFASSCRSSSLGRCTRAAVASGNALSTVGGSASLCSEQPVTVASTLSSAGLNNGGLSGVRMMTMDSPIRSNLKNSPKSEGRSSPSSNSSSPAKRVRFDPNDLLHEYVSGNVDANGVETRATIARTMAMLNDEALALHHSVDGTNDIRETLTGRLAASKKIRNRELNALMTSNQTFVNGFVPTLHTNGVGSHQSQKREEEEKRQPRRSGRLKRESSKTSSPLESAAAASKSSKNDESACSFEAAVACNGSLNSSGCGNLSLCSLDDTLQYGDSVVSNGSPKAHNVNGISPIQSSSKGSSHRHLPIPHVVLRPLPKEMLDVSNPSVLIIGSASGGPLATSPIQRSSGLSSAGGGEASAKQPSPLKASPGGDHRSYCTTSSPSLCERKDWSLCEDDDEVSIASLGNARRLCFSGNSVNGFQVPARPYLALTPSIVVLEPEEMETPEPESSSLNTGRKRSNSFLSRKSLFGIEAESRRLLRSSSSLNLSSDSASELGSCHSNNESFVSLATDSVAGNSQIVIADAKTLPRVQVVKLSAETIASLTVEQSMTQQALERLVHRVTTSDLIAQLFNGRMTLRTKCLECERSSSRDQAFVDLGVSVTPKKMSTHESEMNDLVEDGSRSSRSSGSANRLLSSLSRVERLTAENKYKCTHCLRHVEAEISSHYVDLPPILTIHIKRFARMSGGLGKVLDHVKCPRVLDCIRDGCGAECIEPSHRYHLHAIILHVGLSLTSGHYVAFVRAPPRGCFPHQQPDMASVLLHRSPTEASCGVDSSGGDVGARVVTRRQSQRGQLPRGPVGANAEEGEEVWYECDDDHIRVLSFADLDSRLSAEGAAASPYLLLYHSAAWSWSSAVEHRGQA